MQILSLSHRAVQALLTLIFVAGIAWLFLATEAPTDQADAAPAIAAQPSLYDEYVRSRPASTTTTTTTVARAVPKTVPRPIEPTPISTAPDDIWLRLAACESGDPAYNGPSGYDGAFQFSPPTWNSMNTGFEFAWQAPFEVQLDAAKRLQARSGWGQWPACARKLGLL